MEIGGMNGMNKKLIASVVSCAAIFFMAEKVRATGTPSCSSTNGTCSVVTFSQLSTGTVEKFSLSIPSLSDAARVSVYDPDSNLIDQISIGDPGGTAAWCYAFHYCGLWGVPKVCGASGASVACEAAGSGANGAVSCIASNGGGNPPTQTGGACGS